jgi:UDP-3-O-[3-hydroxymyristoyl] N-acetylglucosamine deacetylase
MKQENSIYQKTIRKPVVVEGIGLHSGKLATVTIKPAQPNAGIVFVRTDLEKPITIPATYDFVTQTKLATTIGRDAAKISTVEHLLCALKMMEIDNAVVEVTGPEVPIMDGSAAPFCKAIEEVGVIADETALRKVAILRKRIEVRMGDKIALIEPSTRFHIDARIEWTHPAIGIQSYSYTVGESNYKEVAYARTFGFMRDVEALKKMGLALGGSFDNAVVMDEEKVLNLEGLRYDDEFVRHKVLDAIGDFALSPVQVLGDVTLVKAGHEMHSELIHAIFSNPDNFEVVTVEDALTEERTMEVLEGEWATAIQRSL